MTPSHHFSVAVILVYWNNQKWYKKYISQGQKLPLQRSYLFSVGDVYTFLIRLNEMANLSPLVYWSQTKQTLLLKVDLKDAKVSGFGPQWVRLPLGKINNDN